ncbi:MAG: hypothetical protein ACFFDE_09070 [Promethearchaeota archaeon]
MNNWKAGGYIFLGCGSVIFIYALYAFFSMIAMLRQIPYMSQIATATALATVAPYLVLGSLMYIIGGVGLFMGRDNKAFSIASSRQKVTEEDLLDRVSRLEGIVDNNFNVITKRLDEIEEKQDMVSQNAIIRAKRE